MPLFRDPAKTFRVLGRYYLLVRELVEGDVEWARRLLELRVEVHCTATGEDPVRVLGRLVDAGVLRRLDAELDTYEVDVDLASMVRRIHGRRELVGPAVLEGYAGSLRMGADRLAELLADRELPLDERRDRIEHALRQLQVHLEDLRRLAEDGEAVIEAELGDYRTASEDRFGGSARRRLDHIDRLCREHLDPALAILRLDGALHQTSEEIRQLCRRGVSRHEDVDDELASLFRQVLRRVDLMRQGHLAYVARIDEAVHPLLAPFRRSRGVVQGASRYLEAVGAGKWALRDEDVALPGRLFPVILTDVAIIGALDAYQIWCRRPQEPVLIAAGAEDPARREEERYLHGLLRRLPSILPVDDLLSWIATDMRSGHGRLILRTFAYCVTNAAHLNMRPTYGEHPVDYRLPPYVVRAHPIRMVAAS